MSVSCSWRRTWRPMRSAARFPQSCSFSQYQSSIVSDLRNELMARKFPNITDYVTPVPANLLRQTLKEFISYPYQGAGVPERMELALGHHLVYFPNPTSLSSLYPDGTDPVHSPGPPFTRRMWAGGSMVARQSIEADSSGYTVMERIEDVQLKGENRGEKLFVTIERGVYRGTKRSEETLKERDLFLIETQTLVFMQAKSQTMSGPLGQSPSKTLKPSKPPEFFVEMIPTPALLFRFSALTFNAHAIHLDKKYCQEVEGHRNLLVHGPLTAILMMDVLRSFLANEEVMGWGNEQIESIEYRNLAPLYAEEMMKVCLKRKNRASNTGSFDVWIEGKDGGYAVKGIVQTSILTSPNTCRRVFPSRDLEDAAKGPANRDDFRDMRGDF